MIHTIKYNNKDKFGYYLVDESYKTYSKVEAIELGSKMSSKVRWCFNNEIFDRYPWHYNAQVDIKKLYKKRAEDIRNKYDYIVVWYSGGSDSFNVLNTFKENNLHVDEIAQFHAYEGEGGWNSYLNKEVESVAIPKTKEFLEAMPHTKHRMVDFTSFIKDLFSEEDNKLNFIYKSNKTLSPHQLARTYFREKIQDYVDIIESGKKLCFVWGGEKPPLKYDDELDKYFLQFYDTVESNGVGPRTQMLRRDWEHDELFYWDPSCPQLISRQAHILVNYLRNPPKEDLDTVWLKQSDRHDEDRRFYGPLYSYDGEYRGSYSRRPFTIIDQTRYFLTYEGMSRLLYPGWDTSTFSFGKTASYIFGPRDSWWHRLRDRDQEMFNSAIKTYYLKFKDKMFKLDPSEDFRHLNFKIFHGNRYYLEK